MTFEEFFRKKKIDLVQLEKDEPVLFSEFKSHYNLMGEKSFDHTKKFWFNKLRRLYHLETLIKESQIQEESKIASQAEPLASPTIEQTVLPGNPVPAATDATTTAPVNKPRFKPRNIPVKEEVKKEEPAVEPAAETSNIVKKPGFKPRNIKLQDTGKPDIEKGDVPLAENAPVPGPSPEAEEPSKPAYKPRFTMKTAVKNAEVSRENEQVPATEGKGDPETGTPAKEEPAKPAYKPRFNMKNIPQKPLEEGPEAPAAAEQPAVENIIKPEEPLAEQTPKQAYKPRFSTKTIVKTTDATPAEGQAPSVAEKGESNAEENISPQEPAKPAYKPRFNMENIPQKPLEEKTEPQDAAPDEPVSVPQPPVAEKPVIEEKPAEAPAKPAYKPRFNMKNIKPREE